MVDSEKLTYTLVVAILTKIGPPVGSNMVFVGVCAKNDRSHIKLSMISQTVLMDTK